ncbi:hypothetical protein H0H92_000674 [Tricholoma furcatifolium]|nr:hypothetical protein H0H92_000674 [Tricholoma furcatifolium]
MTSALSIIHWNDVYRVSPQKLSSHSTDTIDTAQFAALLDDIRNNWVDLPNAKKDGLVLFSGDVFSPSVESSVTRGSHMVDGQMVDEFTENQPHLGARHEHASSRRLFNCETSQVPACLHEFHILERAGIRIGVIGLVEREWIATVATWPPNFKYKDMSETGLDLSRRLREEHRCDLVIALTHCRVPNDIALAKSLHAVSPSAQKNQPIAESHGVDIILGGHDHLYFVSKGVTSWENYDLDEVVLGAEEDHGDILVMKSGTDFRDLSEIKLELEDTPAGSVRTRVIKRITGKRHTVLPGCRSSEKMQKLLKDLLSSVSDTMDAPVCKTAAVIDCRSQYIRTDESAAGNLFADIIRHAYDDALCMQGCGGSDGVLICAGTLRGDSTYGPGIVTLGNILEILPFEDPVVVLELDGAAIWDAVEGALSTWPAQEGRFPVISGFRVSWDSRREPGNRVLGVWKVEEKNHSPANHSDNGASSHEVIDGKPITRESDQNYKIVTREYMAQGHDGFWALKGKRYLVDDESGQLMSSIVRKYLLGKLSVIRSVTTSSNYQRGSQYVNMLVNLVAKSKSTGKLHSRTEAAVARETARRKAADSAAQNWQRAAKLALQWSRKPRLHYQDHLSVCMTEHMSPVDAYDGQSVRKGEDQKKKHHAFEEEDLVVIHPEIDGRLKNVAKEG